MSWIVRLKRRFFDGPALLNYPGRRSRRWQPVLVHVGYWGYAFFVRHFTVAGGVLLALTWVVSAGAAASILMPLFLFSVLLLALFITDMALGWLRRPKLMIQRRLPGTLQVDEPGKVHYTVRNAGELAAWDVLVDHIPVPPAICFEEGRPVVAELGPGATEQFTTRLSVRKRGRYLLPLPVADSSFPFGLWRWGSTGEANQELLALPSYQPLRSLPLPREEAWSKNQDAASVRAGHSLEFLGCREFRFGDSMRHIHPRSWARRGTPVVKEFCEELGGNATLYLDVFAPAQSRFTQGALRVNETLEGAVSLAAAVGDYLLSHGATLDLYHWQHQSGNQVEWNSLRDLIALQAFLEALTDVQRLPARPDQTAEIEVHRLCETQCVFVVLTRWDEARQALLRDLAQRGGTIYACLVTKRPPAERPAWLQVLTPAEIASGDLLDLKDWLVCGN